MRGAIVRLRSVLERVTGIEPVSSAWKADVIAVRPYPRHWRTLQDIPRLRSGIVTVFHGNPFLAALVMDFGGESGIRTHGTSPYDGFRNRCLRPLGHLSMVWTGSCFPSAVFLPVGSVAASFGRAYHFTRLSPRTRGMSVATHVACAPWVSWWSLRGLPRLRSGAFAGLLHRNPCRLRSMGFVVELTGLEPVTSTLPA